MNRWDPTLQPGPEERVDPLNVRGDLMHPRIDRSCLPPGIYCQVDLTHRAEYLRDQILHLCKGNPESNGQYGFMEFAIYPEAGYHPQTTRHRVAVEAGLLLGMHVAYVDSGEHYLFRYLAFTHTNPNERILL